MAVLARDRRASLAVCQLHVERRVLRLRGGGRRRKDWQSPRPGDSDEVFSSSDPDWSVAGDAYDAQRNIDDDSATSVDASEVARSDSSDSGPPRRRAQQRPQQRCRTRRSAQIPNARVSSDSQRQAARGKSRRRVQSYRESSTDEELDSDSPWGSRAPAQRPRGAVSADLNTAQRWGMQATDALDAALRGKPVSSSRSRQRPAAGRSGKSKTLGRRPRRELYDPSDDISPEPVSSSAKERRISKQRTVHSTAQIKGDASDKLHCEAESWGGDVRYDTCAGDFVQPLVLCGKQLPGCASDPSVSHHTSPTRSQGEETERRTSPLQDHVPFVSSNSPVQRVCTDARASSLASVEKDQLYMPRYSETSDGQSSDDDSASLASDERETPIVDNGKVAPVEEVLQELSDQLKSDGKAVLMAHSTTRAWRGVAVGDNVELHDAANDVGSIPAPLSSPMWMKTQEMLTKYAPKEESQAHLTRHGRGSTCLVPIHTDAVLQRLGSLMSEAAQAVTVAGQRQDLESVGLSDDLMVLAKRLDAAMKQSQCISSLLPAPHLLLDDGHFQGDAPRGTLAGQISGDLRSWRRRAIVSGTWHEMQQQSVLLAKAAKLKSSGSAADASSNAGASKIVYVGRSQGLTDQGLRKLMASCGHVVRLHKTDSYSFVEVSSSALGAKCS